MADRVEELERGNLYFLYRPRVETEDPRGLDDIQNLYLVLSPHGKTIYRRLIVGRERMPDPTKSGKRRFWAFVDRVERDPRALADDMGAETYQTKTRGERHQPAARAAGEGVYRILRHGDHTHLVYALELPEQPGEVQRELNIAEEASYIASVKNPGAGSPPGAGLGRRQQARFPKRLQEVFRDRRFAELDPPELLDHEGAELVLIAASDDVEAELGISLDPEHEDESTAEILSDLRLRKSEHPLEPLFEGRWT